MVNPFEVHKFGGTSAADAYCLTRIIDILDREVQQPAVVVVSARAGVTNRLQALIDCAASGGTQWRVALDALLAEEAQNARYLLGDGAADELVHSLNIDGFQVRQRLVHLQWDAARQTTTEGFVLPLGDLWNARLLAAGLAAKRACRFADARLLIFTEDQRPGGVVDYPRTQRAINAVIGHNPAPLTVIPGFIATGPGGQFTHLGRNGSDYSAALLAAALQATKLVIWSDVNGVLSADPDWVPQADNIPAISYGEACRLVRLGTGVLHPNAVAPAMDNQIPIFMRHTFAPEKRGTRIDPHGEGRGEQLIWSGLGDVCLVRPEEGQLARRACQPLLSGRAENGAIYWAEHRTTVSRLVQNGDALSGGFSIVAAVGPVLCRKPSLRKAVLEALSRRAPICFHEWDPSSHTLAAVLSCENPRETVQAMHAVFRSSVDLDRRKFEADCSKSSVDRSRSIVDHSKFEVDRSGFAVRS